MMSTKIISWNVNGIRTKIINDKTSTKKCDILIEPDSNMGKMINDYNPDIICLSEVRCSEEISSRIKCDTYPFKYYNQSTRTERGRGAGYSGTAIWSKKEPIRIIKELPSLTESNIEGRVLVAEYDNYYLINVYTPNSGSNEEYRINQWDHAMLEYINMLKLEKEVILVGDMNVAHTQLDYHDKIPKNKRIVGLLPEEIDNFSNYINNGLIDTFRYKYPNISTGYTWWCPFKKEFRIYNKGWRLDYSLITNGLKEKMIDSIILKDVMGSDHCPILLEIDF
jgi:exodeoxyribonuclease III